MELRDFVRTVISQITDGLVDAIEHHDARELPGKINPVFQDDEGKWDWKSAVQNIEFDISVTVEDKMSAEGKGSAKVYVANVDVEGSRTIGRSNVNTIKFVIPMSFPAHAVTGGISYSKKPV